MPPPINRALVTVHDFRLAAAECALETPEHKALLERAGQLVIDDFAVVPVNDEEQVHKTFAHPQIRDVNSPDLVRPIDRHTAKQVGTRVGGMQPFAQVRLRIHGFEPHELHETAYAHAIDLKALIAKDPRHAPIAVERMLHVDLVESGA